MPLDANGQIQGKRNKGLPVVLGVTPLTSSDLDKLAETRGVTAPPLKRLSDRHHKLARAIASGRSLSECAIIAGYDPSRVSVLKTDATFQDLISYYRSQGARGDDLLLNELTGLSFDSVTEMRRRVEENPDDLSVDELARLAQLGLDRSGYGPKRTEEKNLTVNFGDRLEAARKRVIEHEAAADYVDVTPQEAAE